MSRIFDLKQRMREVGVEAKKSFGQNFLISDHVIEKILEAVEVEKISSVVEVGPGLGALTDGLLAKGFRPLVIELDKKLVEYWRGRGLTVVDQDALKLKWESLNLSVPTIFVSNLPYQISTSILVDRCFGPESITVMVLMFQKEVAERFTAKPKTKEYGLLSVMAQLFWDLEKVANAAPRDFFPPPKIASRVLKWRRKPSLGLDIRFLKFLKAAFLYRRKFLLKNLKGSVTNGFDTRIREAFGSMKISEKARAEELTPQQFVELFRKLYEH